MKTIKSLITLLLLTIGVAVQAQTVVIEKTDGTSDEYDLADIDSVAYEPIRYYWYVGWNMPKSEDELIQLVANIDKKTAIGGYKTTNLGYSLENPLFTITNAISNSTRNTYYVVLPKNCNIYQGFINLTSSNYVEKEMLSVNAPNDHIIYESTSEARNITGICAY